MLAQLDEAPGVEESRIDWTGRWFLLKLEKDAVPIRVLDGARDVIGPKARRLLPTAEAERIETFRRGEPWMRGGETLRLSGEEARVLGERFGSKAAEDAALDAAKATRLTAIVQEEAKRLLEGLHEREGDVSGRFAEGWAPAVERVDKRCREFLTPAEAERVGASLRAQLE